MWRIFTPILLSFFMMAPVAAQSVAGNDSSSFTFIPDYILPRTGAARPLYGVTYSLMLTKDSLLVDLPYEGRAWSVVSPDPRYQGIRFTAVRFEVRSKKLRRGVRQVTISPKDGIDIYRLSLTIPPKGDASLQVYSDRRDMAGFSGRLTYNH